ncbi:hypothetical protein F4804DRAFT_239260 [Jackrogersella minutella]|nr:hypothetical protein F4804DRAFT_239260 [Jackrogersella minutella]
MSIFPVYCTAQVPILIIEKFLTDALNGSNKLAPGSEPSLAIVTAANGVPTTASSPPLQPFTSPFIGQSVEQISRQFNEMAHFSVLDERSTEDETAVLVERNSDDSIHTVRVTFGSSQSLLTALDVATLGFTEIQNIATSSGGVYGKNHPSPQEGQLAPRKRLGGD